MSLPKITRHTALAVVTLMAVVALGVVAYKYAARKSVEPTASAVPSPAPATGLRLVPAKKPVPLPEVRFTDGEGRSLTLADFRGRIVLLNLWATWCTPCREEMPTLDRLQARLGGTDFEVVALSIDHDGIAAVRKFYQEIGIKHLRIYNDPTTDATARLSVIGIPATLLIDREGREVGRALGPAEWDAPEVVETVRKHLNDPRKP
jgi:thiol-disulfide isomerase/thioredoxin